MLLAPRPALEPYSSTPPAGFDGRVIYVEDFRAPNPGVWNDGLGSAYRDCDVMLGGLPTLRLDNQGQTGSGSNPGRTAVTSGVVVKRRIHDGYRGRFGMEFWFRFTSLFLTAGTTFLSASMYNRDGASAHHARVWLDPNGNNQPMKGRILDGAATAVGSGTNPANAATYTDVVTSVQQNGAGSHNYDPNSGRGDRAGGWHWCKMVVDFATKKYVSLHLDGEFVDLSAYLLDITDSAGMAGMHHSFEFFATTGTRPRFLHIGGMVGTLEN